MIVDFSLKFLICQVTLAIRTLVAAKYRPMYVLVVLTMVQGKHPWNQADMVPERRVQIQELLVKVSNILNDNPIVRSDINKN